MDGQVCVQSLQMFRAKAKQTETAQDLRASNLNEISSSPAKSSASEETMSFENGHAIRTAWAIDY